MRKKIIEKVYLCPNVICVEKIEFDTSICETSPIVVENNTIDIEKQNEGTDFSFNW